MKRLHAVSPSPCVGTAIHPILVRAFSVWAVYVGALLIAIVGDASPVDAQEVPQQEQPTHHEVGPITLQIGNQGRLETMAMNPAGELLAAVTWLEKKPDADGDPPGTSDPSYWDYWSERRQIQVLNGLGEKLRSFEIEGVVPLQICPAEDGDIYLGGEYVIAKIDQQGQLIKKVKIVDVIPDVTADTHVSGLAVSDEYLFVAIGSGRSLRATEDIVRMSRDLTDPVMIIERQFGCCSHIDMDIDGDVLLVAENSRHRVNRFDFDGELLSQWGKRDRTGIEGFAACCNPVNFDMIGDRLITAESGIGRVKEFSPDGQFKQLIGYVDTTKFDKGSRVAAASCYIPVEVGLDDQRIYVMDVRANSIRVLQRTEK